MTMPSSNDALESEYHLYDHHCFGQVELYIELPLAILAVMIIVLSYGMILCILAQQKRKVASHNSTSNQSQVKSPIKTDPMPNPVESSNPTVFPQSKTSVISTKIDTNNIRSDAALDKLFDASPMSQVVFSTKRNDVPSDSDSIFKHTNKDYFQKPEVSNSTPMSNVDFISSESCGKLCHNNENDSQPSSKESDNDNTVGDTPKGPKEDVYSQNKCIKSKCFLAKNYDEDNCEADNKSAIFITNQSEHLNTTEDSSKIIQLGTSLTKKSDVILFNANRTLDFNKGGNENGPHAEFSPRKRIARKMRHTTPSDLIEKDEERMYQRDGYASESVEEITYISRSTRKQTDTSYISINTPQISINSQILSVDSLLQTENKIPSDRLSSVNDGMMTPIIFTEIITAETEPTSVTPLPGPSNHDASCLADVYNKEGMVTLSTQKLGNPNSLAPNVVIEGEVCLINPQNKVMRRRRVELKAALKVGFLLACFVCLWIPLPLFVSIVKSQSIDISNSNCHIAIAILLATASMTAAMDPIVYGLLNQQIRGGLRDNIKRAKRCLLKRIR